MWLEQTIWIWAPLACATLTWLASRVGTLGREVRSLHIRVTQLEQAADRPVKTEDRVLSAA
jgi:hypothetical protein